jgi:hypothetical protein
VKKLMSYFILTIVKLVENLHAHVGLVLRNRSRKVNWLVAGAGWVAVLGSSALFTYLKW